MKTNVRDFYFHMNQLILLKRLLGMIVVRGGHVVLKYGMCTPTESGILRPKYTKQTSVI